MRLPLALAALVLLAAPPSAQSEPDDVRVLVVTGSGEATARSDRAVLQVAFETDGETADEALHQHEAEVARVRRILAARGVPDARVSVDRASVAPAGGRRFPNGPGGADDGYSVSRQLTVEVDDLDAVPALVAALSTDADDDALTVQRRTVNVAYVLADPGPLGREALREAITDARERAELMAEMAGVTLGEILDVSEGFAAGGGGEMAMVQAMMREAARMENGAGAGVDHRVGASVVVTFRIR